MKLKATTAAVSAAMLSLLCTTQASAAQIYPVDQARFMTNARFDFKVELDSAITARHYRAKKSGLKRKTAFMALP